MKTFTTLTAVAALIAGMSIASAQSSMSPGSSQSSGQMKSQSGSSGQQQVTGNGKFCIQQSAGGAWNCKYASLAACEKDGKAQNLQCQANPNQSTTGQKQ